MAYNKIIFKVESGIKIIEMGKWVTNAPTETKRHVHSQFVQCLLGACHSYGMWCRYNNQEKKVMLDFHRYTENIVELNIVKSGFCFI